MSHEKRTGCARPNPPAGEGGEVGRDKRDSERGGLPFGLFEVFEEEIKEGLIAIRVITRQNDCIWATGSKKGLNPVREELKEIVNILGGNYTTL